MECPRCGFRQPEDIYCARCGVSIRKALRRRYARWSVGIAAAAGLFIWGTLALVSRVHRADEAGHQTSRGITKPKLPGGQPLQQPATEQHHSSTVKRKARKPIPSPSAPSAVGTRPRNPQAGRPPSLFPQDSSGTVAEPERQRGPEADPEDQIRRWAALEWFDQGQALSDNSEEELDFYRRALEVSPRFAPAAYFMGVIYLEWGDREAALRAFRRFLQHATLEELQRYPLPETITSEELEDIPSSPP